jgi:chromosome segregation ATPase
MAEVTNELIYEVLKNIQARMGNLEDSVREIKTELQALRGHMVAMQTDISNLYAGQAKIELRLERIERRLELADVAV